MRQTFSDGIFVIWIDEQRSTFITQILYHTDNEELTICFKDKNVYTYKNVPIETFVEFSMVKSFGSYYNSNIKNKFKKMADEKKKPKGINKAKKEKRYIDIDINLTKVNKEWLYKSDTGAIYLKMVLFMLPDGEVDKYERLGFVKQSVPPGIEERGEILGNAKENDWTREEEKIVPIRKEEIDELDSLPF